MLRKQHCFWPQTAIGDMTPAAPAGRITSRATSNCAHSHRQINNEPEIIITRVKGCWEHAAVQYSAWRERMCGCVLVRVKRGGGHLDSVGGEGDSER